MVVMRGLRRIAESGRAVCATIHQPSISIFSDFDSLLLLKRGGEVVFYGDLGERSVNLITYLERFEATPKIRLGENPGTEKHNPQRRCKTRRSVPVSSNPSSFLATWMLTTIGAGSIGAGSRSGRQFDYAGSYLDSKLHEQCLEKIKRINSGATDDNRVVFLSKFATSFSTQMRAVLQRAMTIFYRTPNYNVTRNIVSIVVALLFGSVYAQEPTPKSEGDINSIFNSVFVSVIFVCVSGQNTVLSFFEKERNMYYKHKAANMYNSAALLGAHTLSEYPFVLLSSAVFVVPFYFIMGFEPDAEKFFL